jgi:ABC-type branched-subunit amino acid transport system substrate-binding protein
VPRKIVLFALGIALILGLHVKTAWAQDPGVTATEIKIGNTAPYSGPASAYGTILKTVAAYFRKVNDEGGINGRKINFISYDDSYSPPKTYEMTRKLVEQDHVLLDFAPLGTPPNTAIWKYMNQHQVPQLFVLTGASKWGDPKGHPWTMGWQPTYYSEASVYAHYVLDHIPHAKIGILYQNDDYGKDYLAGFEDGLAAQGRRLIVNRQSYEVTDPRIDSQIVNLKNSGANVFVNITTPKFAAMAIRKVHEIGWRPVQFLNNVSASVGAVLKPAGFEASKGVMTGIFGKDPSDPMWKDDPAMKRYYAFLQRYNPAADPKDAFNAVGYSVAQTLVYVLKRSGNNLSRANIMREAANIRDLNLPLLMSGIMINTSPTDFYPIKQLQLAKFNGQRWEPFGTVYAGAINRQALVQ